MKSVFFFEVESRKFTMNQNVDIANGVYNLLQSLFRTIRKPLQSSIFAESGTIGKRDNSVKFGAESKDSQTLNLEGLFLRGGAAS